MNGFDQLVLTDWLAAHLHDSKVKVIDSSWYMPQENRDAHAEYRAGHIPGARFFDIDKIAAHDSDLPHMVPTPQDFARDVGQMGIAQDDFLVIYDTSGVNRTAARAWWMFRLFGHEHVAILDGGYKAWQAESRPIETGEPVFQPTDYRAGFVFEMIAYLKDIQRAVLHKAPQILDARAAERFEGRVPEPRAGLRAGHMPGARNLPFTALTDPQTGKMYDLETIRHLFAAAGIDVEKPAILSCGSGVTACLLAFAPERLGHTAWSVYDGSWSEWGGLADAPIETGPAS